MFRITAIASVIAMVLAAASLRRRTNFADGTANLFTGLCSTSTTRNLGFSDF